VPPSQSDSLDLRSLTSLAPSHPPSIAWSPAAFLRVLPLPRVLLPSTRQTRKLSARQQEGKPRDRTTALPTPPAASPAAAPSKPAPPAHAAGEEVAKLLAAAIPEGGASTMGGPAPGGGSAPGEEAAEKPQFAGWMALAGGGT
jgi:hypothetical protein